MAERAKRQKEPEKPRKSEPSAEDLRRCWLCSQPLGTGGATSLLGRGLFEVHRRCYDEAMRS